MRVVIAGNVAWDRGPDGADRPGGPSLYAAAAARALGADVRLVTRLPAGYPQDALAGLEVQAAAGNIPVYANRYDDAGRRTQHLLEPGDPLPVPLGDPGGIDAVLLAPAYHEFETVPDWDAPVRVVALQGLLRQADRSGRVRQIATPRTVVTPFVAPGVIATFSDEDVEEFATLGGDISSAGGVAAATLGAAGAVLYRPNLEPVNFPSYPAHEVDPTGAGDCFAAALLVRVVETGDLEDACRFASAAASLSVEGQGLAGVPTRASVAQRLYQGAA